jgi:hypothetical protein
MVRNWIEYKPSWPVIVLVLTPVLTFVAVTLLLDRTAPLSSKIVPRTVAVMVCAVAGIKLSSKQNASKQHVLAMCPL